MEKTLKERIELEENQRKILKDIEKGIKGWEDYSLEKRGEFLKNIPTDLILLLDSEQEMMINELSKAGICKKGQLRKEIKSAKNLWSSIIEKKTEGQEKDKKVKEKTKTLIPGLIHLVKDESRVKYLLQNENGLYIEEAFILSDGITCKPKQDLAFKMVEPDILNLSGELNYKELLDEMIRFIASYLELPSESDYLILALWTFHTYLIDKFATTPILYFFGIMEVGKTRAGEVLGELAYKAERMTSPTEATLFRSAEYFKTTLIIDEIKLWGQDGNKNVADLIKSRYKRGLKVSRVNLNKKGEDQIEYFDVFAPLVISTTEIIPDIIESRCIKFLMQRNSDPKVEQCIDLDWAKELRNKLTLFRANFMDKELPEVDHISKGRLNEILMPLYRTLLLIDNRRKEEFRETVVKLENRKKIEENTSLEAEILEEVLNYCEEEERYSFLTLTITEKVNKKKTLKDEISSKMVSRCLKRMGLEKVRIEGGRMGYKASKELLQKLMLQLGFTPRELTLFST
ncbi:hypothetical protein ES708_27298 [subsurface metagenome]